MRSYKMAVTFLMVQIAVFICGTEFQYSKSNITRRTGKVLQVISGLAIVTFLIVRVIHGGPY